MLAGRDELVDDHLRTVREIAELRFPHDQRMRFRGTVSVFEPENAELRQGAVDDLKRRLPEADVAERDIGFFGFLIDQCGVPLAESATAAILAGKPNLCRFDQQRPNGQRLAGRPIEPFAGFEHLLFGRELANDLAVRYEVLRQLGQRGPDLSQHVHVHGRFTPPRVAGSDGNAFPLAFEPVGLVRLV